MTQELTIEELEAVVENRQAQDWRDREANMFAMCLLMPKEWVFREAHNLDPELKMDTQKVAMLAKKFKVEEQVMLARLIQLGIVKILGT